MLCFRNWCSESSWCPCCALLATGGTESTTSTLGQKSKRNIEKWCIIWWGQSVTRLVSESTTLQLVPAEVESLFAKELAKRGISSSSVDDDGAALESSGRSVPPPQLAQQKAAPSDTPQLEKSRALNSEGLEGLIPRASELIRLGGGFFLGFVPFILLVSMLFVGMYVVRIPGASLQPIQSLFPCLPMNMARTDRSWTSPLMYSYELAAGLWRPVHSHRQPLDNAA